MPMILLRLERFQRAGVACEACDVTSAWKEQGRKQWGGSKRRECYGRWSSSTTTGVYIIVTFKRHSISHPVGKAERSISAAPGWSSGLYPTNCILIGRFANISEASYQLPGITTQYIGYRSHRGEVIPMLISGCELVTAVLHLLGYGILVAATFNHGDLHCSAYCIIACAASLHLSLILFRRVRKLALRFRRS
jgi:hypothetical protein